MGGEDRDRIGRHAVIRPLARGGMAELFLVRTTGLQGFQKIVALKRILPQFSGDPDFVQMFLDEARLAASLDHPNVAQVYDIGRDGSDYFFTMEYVHGEDLRRILRAVRESDGRMPSSHAVAIASGVAAGLHHAHSRIGYDGVPLGLVHRDVSPTNVLLSYDGAVKVVDFGVAKAAASSHTTTEGTRKGKAAYMSPEQCRGEPVDARSDVFAIGILLYEMCTMRRAFAGDNEFAIMRKIVEGELVSPRDVVPDMLPELEAILLRAMAFDREERYPTARELQLDLDALARERKWHGSQAALSEYLVYLFGDKPYPWEGVPGIGEVQEQADGSFVTSDMPATKAKPMPEALPRVDATVPALPMGPPGAGAGASKRRFAPLVVGGAMMVGAIAIVTVGQRDAADASPRPSAVAETPPEPEPEPEPEVEAEPEVEPEPDVEPEPELEPEPEPEPEQEPELEPEPAKTKMAKKVSKGRKPAKRKRAENADPPVTDGAREPKRLDPNAPIGIPDEFK